jgi:hypothetical protein
MSAATPKEALDLLFALNRRGISAQIEDDQTIDVELKGIMMNIEVDSHHYYMNPSQALLDLKKTLYAFKSGCLNLSIPISLVKSNLEETACFITEDLIERKNLVSGWFRA